MLAAWPSARRTRVEPLVETQELGVVPTVAFARVCELEKWPVWFSLATSVRRVERGAATLACGDEVALRSSIPGEPEEIYAVDQLVPDRRLVLVGIYSLRRRIEITVEPCGAYAQIELSVGYPIYGGAVGIFADGLRRRRRLQRMLAASLLDFKALVEYRTDDVALGDL